MAVGEVGVGHTSSSSFLLPVASAGKPQGQASRRLAKRGLSSASS